MDERDVGANLPWLDYGRTSDERLAARGRPRGPRAARSAARELGRLAESGARLVRLWLLGDGRAGLALDTAGRPTGLDERFLPDLDAALAALRETGLRGLLVLLDFLWFAPARHEGGVQLGGRRELVRDPEQRARLREHVFARSPSAAAARRRSPPST